VARVRAERDFLLRHFSQFLVLLAVMLRCGLASAVPPQQATQNVILITIDTVRADRLGCYGASNIQTPTLDSLAHDGIVFERAISQVPLTWPSHAAILTGTYPFQNGVQDFTGQPMDERFRSVAQVFKQQGYATGAVVSAFVLDRSWGLARGFDFYDDAFSAQAFRQKDIGLVDRKAGESVTRALAWLNKWKDKATRQPFFFWLHLYDPHSPYNPPEPFATQYRGHLYDGEVAYADHELGRMITWLKQNRLYDHSLIVFVSDHGESLGEHGEKEHGLFVYNSTIHVPLILKPPTGSGVWPRRVTRPVETVAIAPTMIRLAGVKNTVEKQFQSPSLLEGDAGDDAAAYSESFYSFSSFGWSPLHALETKRYHFIEAPTPELYDVVADPQERNNIAANQTATVAVLAHKLQGLLQRNSFKPVENATSGLSPDALEKLRALGYVAYRSPISPEALAAGLPDPKSRLWELNAILEAGDAYHAGEFSAGDALLAKVREGDPKMYIVPFMLGENALRQQNWAEAANELEECLNLNPNFDQAMTGLARALFDLGRIDEAKAWLDKALKFNPKNYRAWYERGFMESKTDEAAAIADMEKAVSIQPNLPSLRRDLGMLQFQHQNYTEAVNHLAKAAELGIADAPLYNFLGVSLSRTGQLRKAIQSYKQAIKLDPNLAEAHLNLGFAYQRLNHPLMAHKEYQEACRLEKKFCQSTAH
jgi:arylsulfatase A-like enzyme/Tfp pilus assembly protein PilF